MLMISPSDFDLGQTQVWLRFEQVLTQVVEIHDNPKSITQRATYWKLPILDFSKFAKCETPNPKQIGKLRHDAVFRDKETSKELTTKYGKNKHKKMIAPKVAKTEISWTRNEQKVVTFSLLCFWNSFAVEDLMGTA
jgi:hypothetical protein